MLHHVLRAVVGHAAFSGCKLFIDSRLAGGMAPKKVEAKAGAEAKNKSSAAAAATTTADAPDDHARPSSEPSASSADKGAGKGPASKSKAKAKAKARAALHLEEEKVPAQRKRKLQRRDTAEKVERALKAHTQGLPQRAVDGTRNAEGLTMRDKVERDIRALHPTNGRLSPKWWADTFAEYGVAGDPMANLEVVNKDEPVAAALAGGLAAISVLNPCNRNPRPLISYLGQCTSLSHREVTGTLRLVGKFCSSGARQHDPVWLAIGSALVRFGGSATYPQAVAAIRTFLDGAMVRDWADMKRKHVKPETYVTIHLDVLSMLCDRVDWQSILACGKDYGLVRDSISRVCTSQVGSSLYAWTSASMCASDFSEEVMGHLETLAAKISAPGIATFRAEMTKLTTKLHETEAKVALTRRTVSVSYLGEELSLVASDATQEWVLHLASLLKSIAVDEGHLGPTFVEQWLGKGPDSPTPMSSVPMEELRGSSAARRLLADMTRDDDKKHTFASLQKIVKEAKAKLLGADSTFAIEVAYIEQAQTWVEQRIEQLILSKLPSESRWMAISDSIYELRSLKSMPILEKAGQSSHGLLEGIVEMLSNMDKGIAPDPNLKGSGVFLHEVWLRLECFARFSKPAAAGSSGDDHALYGRAALAATFDDIRHKMDADPATVSFGDLNELQRFKWLLNEEETKTLSSWTDLILDGMAKAGKTRLPAADPASSTHASKRKRSKKQQQQPFEDDKSRIMSFFG